MNSNTHLNHPHSALSTQHFALAFRVTGTLPPRKTTTPSMWTRNSQARRLIVLRQAAIVALQGRAPFAGDVRLALTVMIGTPNMRRKGDLDAYVAGVCDGLMAATPVAKLSPLWSDPASHAVRPSLPIAFHDDYQVVSIRADKLPGTDGNTWYEVVLEAAL